MLFIPEPHRKWIIVKARQEDMELIEGWIKRLDKAMPTITADQSLTEIQSRNQVVQRFIKLEHYDPVKMSAIVTPLLTDTGHVTAEEGTATLLIIDTVENLCIEAVIAHSMWRGRHRDRDLLRFASAARRRSSSCWRRS
jgi:type II secretory pathway component GspD/PulD (secretin)